ncbi:MAG: hypothetical protein M1834_003804 [Cirrosporium novae-zelandiae]|nr:MAG: hypothetical protein M1834_003804 [Cirrosporium novae-zelandiae]
MRGGTSNGLMINGSTFPEDKSQWQPILSSAMGSPDPYKRQLNGMGSGISSTSKVMVVEKSIRDDADIDYTFVQVGIEDGSLDMAGNCGNMSAAVGPFALNEGLLEAPSLETRSDGYNYTTIRMFNTNTGKMINSTFKVSSSDPQTMKFDDSGTYGIDGVPSLSSKIALSFDNPGGSKTGLVLPTGNPVDTIQRLPVRQPNVLEILYPQVSLVDVATPGVFVNASTLNIDTSVPPTELESNKRVMIDLEHIRREGATIMGLDPNIQSLPKIVLLSKPTNAAAKEGVHINCRALSMGQAHRAMPMTMALNLAAACKLKGTVPNQIVSEFDIDDTIVIGHPSGKLEVGVDMDGDTIRSATIYRTARALMKGDVFY